MDGWFTVHSSWFYPDKIKKNKDGFCDRSSVIIVLIRLNQGRFSILSNTSDGLFWDFNILGIGKSVCLKLYRSDCQVDWLYSNLTFCNFTLVAIKFWKTLWQSQSFFHTMKTLSELCKKYVFLCLVKIFQADYILF